MDFKLINRITAGVVFFNFVFCIAGYSSAIGFILGLRRVYSRFLFSTGASPTGSSIFPPFGTIFLDDSIRRKHRFQGEYGVGYLKCAINSLFISDYCKSN